MPRDEEAGGVRERRVLAGEGMLIAKVDGTYIDEFGRHEVKAGVTRVAPDHPLAKARPGVFRVAWRKDAITAKQHRDNLPARMEELRGYRLTARTTKRSRRSPQGLALGHGKSPIGTSDDLPRTSSKELRLGFYSFVPSRRRPRRFPALSSAPGVPVVAGFRLHQHSAAPLGCLSRGRCVGRANGALP
jgi:hypothetical protein